MSTIDTLAQRIDAAFAAVEAKVKQAQAEKLEEHKQRQARLQQLTNLFEELQEIWGPRLQLLVDRFGDAAQSKPRFAPSTREVTFAFQSRLARVQLKFAAYTDRDVRSLILSYDLEIIPVLMRFNPHAEIEFPLDAVDKAAVARWLDDRIVEFVQTYFAMGENEIYLRDHMVEDPVAGVRFPKQAAAAHLESGGRTFYFISEETREEFMAKEKAPSA